MRESLWRCFARVATGRLRQRQQLSALGPVAAKVLGFQEQARAAPARSLDNAGPTRMHSGAGGDDLVPLLLVLRTARSVMFRCSTLTLGEIRLSLAGRQTHPVSQG